MRRRAAKVLKILIVVIVVVIGMTALRIYTYGGTTSDTKADAAIVLGAAVWSQGVSPVFRERINHAIDLYRRQRVHKIIFTGGQGNPNEPTEAAAARAYALSNGIRITDILIEQRSHTTYENLVYAKQLADMYGLKKVLIVSDPMHMKRAISMAHDVGLDAYPSPTSTTRYTGFRSQVEELTRETFYYLGYTVSSFLRLPSAQPVAVSASTETVSSGNTDFDKHVEILKKIVPSRDFSIVVQRPFVVIGDEPEPVVKERAEATIKL